MIFLILKTLAKRGTDIFGGGVFRNFADGFGFLRGPETSYLAGPDDIYASPSQIRRLIYIRATQLRARFVLQKKVNVIFALLYGQ